jgi:RHS repeat-associated protein
MICTIDDGSMVKKIDYPGSGNSSQFSSDGAGNQRLAIEYASGSPLSTKQFIWSNGKRLEERISGGPAKEFFIQGELVSNGTSSTMQYFSVDHLGSIREVSDAGGSLLSEIGYDPFGRTQNYSGSSASSFGYSGYFVHKRSSLSLTKFRQFSATNGRWLSRDPVSNSSASEYAYVGNAPTLSIDSLGLNPDYGLDRAMGTASLMSALPQMLSLCNCSCLDKSRQGTCKVDAMLIVASLITTWNSNYGNGPWGGSQAVGGWACWDWSIGFVDSVQNVSSSVWAANFRRFDLP